MPTETESCRSRLAKYCVGTGLDIGFGGTPIVPTAICLDRPETDIRRHRVDAPFPTHIAGDASRLVWFAEGVLDYVYSSHCLEDFENTSATIAEWLRVIRQGGYLVLFLPDEQTYRRCTGDTLRNQAHKHETFSLEYIQKCVLDLGYPSSSIIHALFPVPNNPYSFDFVMRKP